MKDKVFWCSFLISALGAILVVDACNYATPCTSMVLNIDGRESEPICNGFSGTTETNVELGLDAPVWFTFDAPSTGCVSLDYDMFLPESILNKRFGNVEMFVFKQTAREEPSCDGTLQLIQYDPDFFGIIDKKGPFFSSPKIIGTTFEPGQTYYGALDVENPYRFDGQPHTFSGRVQAKACTTQCPPMLVRPVRWMHCAIFGFYLPPWWRWFVKGEQQQTVN